MAFQYKSVWSGVGLAVSEIRLQWRLFMDVLAATGDDGYNTGPRRVFYSMERTDKDRDTF